MQYSIPGHRRFATALAQTAAAGSQKPEDEVEPFKVPHEDVDSMRVSAPPDTDAMRVVKSPNDPTLETKVQPMFKNLPAIEHLVSARVPINPEIFGTGTKGEKGEIWNCWRGDPKLNPKRGIPHPSEEATMQEENNVPNDSNTPLYFGPAEAEKIARAVIEKEDQAAAQDPSRPPHHTARFSLADGVMGEGAKLESEDKVLDVNLPEHWASKEPEVVSNSNDATKQQIGVEAAKAISDPEFVQELVTKVSDKSNFIESIGTEKQGTDVLVEAADRNAGSPVRTINGVDVIPLKDVATPDGIKPFADGKIVGVFDQNTDNQTLVERLGEPDVFITRNLEKEGVAEPTAWMRGLNLAVYAAGSLENKIFLVNQQLRLRISEYVDVPMSTRMKHRGEVADIKPDDWYRVAAALIVPAMIAMEPKAAPAATA